MQVTEEAKHQWFNQFHGPDIFSWHDVTASQHLALSIDHAASPLSPTQKQFSSILAYSHSPPEDYWQPPQVSSALLYDTHLHSKAG